MDGPQMWGSADLDEDEFVERFERCEYPNDKFRHTDHIRLAWIYIRRCGLLEGEARMAASIRRFAISLGHEEKYHATITRAWMRLVYAAYRATPMTRDFGRFLGSHMWLTDKGTLDAFYSQTLLTSGDARHHWVEPDVQDLPELAAPVLEKENLSAQQRPALISC